MVSNPADDSDASEVEGRSCSQKRHIGLGHDATFHCAERVKY